MFNPAFISIDNRNKSADIFCSLQDLTDACEQREDVLSPLDSAERYQACVCFLSWTNLPPTQLQTYIQDGCSEHWDGVINCPVPVLRDGACWKAASRFCASQPLPDSCSDFCQELMSSEPKCWSQYSLWCYLSPRPDGEALSGLVGRYFRENPRLFFPLYLRSSEFCDCLPSCLGFRYHPVGFPKVQFFA